jgi:hypothetical protein
LRNQLFDYAHKNNISFDHPAFRDRWNELNGMIRLTHISHPMFFSSFFTLKNKNDKFELYRSKKEENLKLLTEQNRKFFHQNMNEQFNLFYSYLVKSSIILLVFSFVLAIIFFAVAYLYNINNRSKLRKQIRDHAEPIFENYNFRSLRMA